MSKASVSTNLVNNFSEKVQPKRVVSNKKEFIPKSLASPSMALATTSCKKPKLEDTNSISTSSWKLATPKKEQKIVGMDTDFKFLKGKDPKNKVKDAGVDTVFTSLNRASNKARNVVPRFNLNKSEQFSASVSRPLQNDSENEPRSTKN